VRSTTTTIAAFVAAVAAGAAWPWFAAARNAPAIVAAAPVNADYRLRDRQIAFFERQARSDPANQIFLRQLAAEFMQRFREYGDLADVMRAKALAQRSLRLQPQGNVQALGILASADIAFHEFDAAQRAQEASIEADPSSSASRAQLAQTLMERGQYRAADRLLLEGGDAASDPTWLSIRARYNELAGNLAGARIEMASATAQVDRLLEVSAYSRSWFHLRCGQLALEAGDDRAAETQFDEALRIFPDNSAALLAQARLYRARGDWTSALTAASRSAALYPLPQALGYQADAQRALGDARGAAQTDALIDAERRLYNIQGVNDRLLAMYYAQHRTHLAVALQMARADLAKRGDEIYADDTMAWVLAAMGRRREASVYVRRAMRLGTQDPVLRCHAAAIAAAGPNACAY
jgi:predicted Zn-dependent protease